MSKPKFTPGPWHEGKSTGWWATKDNASYWAQADISNSKGVGVALVVTTKHHTDTEFNANAHLIAAAPELYQLLADFPGFTDDAAIGDAWIEKKNAILAKARGE